MRTPIPLLMRESVPLTYAAQAAKALNQLPYRAAPGTQQQRLEVAFRSMPHNITVKMRLARVSARYDLALNARKPLRQKTYADLTA